MDCMFVSICCSYFIIVAVVVIVVLVIGAMSLICSPCRVLATQEPCYLNDRTHRPRPTARRLVSCAVSIHAHRHCMDMRHSHATGAYATGRSSRGLVETVETRYRHSSLAGRLVMPPGDADIDGGLDDGYSYGLCSYGHLTMASVSTTAPLSESQKKPQYSRSCTY